MKTGFAQNLLDEVNITLNKETQSLTKLCRHSRQLDSYRTAAITARGFGRREESRKVAELISKTLKNAREYEAVLERSESKSKR